MTDFALQYPTAAAVVGTIGLGVPLAIAGAGAIGAAIVVGGTAAGIEAAEGGFSATELAVINEARSIVAAPRFAELIAANQSGESVVVNIGARVIQYEPGLPASGMTMFGENGFVLGREAFATASELNQTVLHELYRLSFSRAAGGVSATLATQETNAAASFAARAAGLLP